MAVDVSKIPNNNKFDPVRVAILNLQGQIEDTGATIGNGTLTINTSGILTGSGTFTANQTGPTTISIGIDGAEYLTNITHDTINQKLVVTRGDDTTFDINLSQYIDDTNLARLVSGTLDNQTGIATFTRDDATTFTVDLSALFDDTDTNDFLTAASFNTADGIVTFTVQNQTDVTVDLDGRYPLFSDLDDFITLGDLSASTNATPFGGGALLYDQATGDFEYTPPDLSGFVSSSELDNYLEFTDLSANNFPNDPAFPGGKVEYSETTGSISFYAADTSGGDADTLDGLDSTQFLRSDANDSTSGTLDVNGGLVRVTGDVSNIAKVILSEGGGDDHVILEYDGTGSGATNYFHIYSGLTGWAAKGSSLNIQPLTGKVAIGTTSFTEKFEVAGNMMLDASNANLKIKAGAAGTKGDIQWTFNSDSTTYASVGLEYDNRTTDGFLIDSGYPITLDYASSYIRFSNNGSEKMRLTSSGRLGLDTTNPEVDLQVGNHTGSRRILLYGANSTLDSSELIFADSSGDARIYKYGAGLRFNSLDNILSIRSWFSGSDEQDVSMVDFYRNTATEDTPIQFRFDSSFDGRLGVKTTTPDAEMQVVGKGMIGSSSLPATGFWGQADNLIIGGESLSGMTIYTSSTTGNSVIAFADENTSGSSGFTTGGVIYYEHSTDNLVTRVNGTESIRINSNGFIAIGKTNADYRLDVTGGSATGFRSYSDGFACVDIESARTSGNIGGVRWETAGDSHKTAEINAIVNGGLVFRTGTGASAISTAVTIGANNSVDVAGIHHANEYRLVSTTDGNHYLKKVTTGYSGITIDGPQLQGHQGGELTTNYTGNNWALRWAIGGNVFVNNALNAGTGNTDSYVRSYYSDGAYTEMRGYGLYFSRTASYIRPTVNNTHNMYFGRSNLVWANIDMYSNTHTWYQGTSAQMRLNSTGLGIGTTSPSAKLDVNGAIRTSGGSFSASVDSVSNAGLVVKQGQKIYSLANSDQYLRNLIEHNTSNNIIIGQTGTGLINDIWLQTGSSGNVRFYTDGGETMRIASDGKLHVENDIIAFSTTVSDARLKDEVVTIDNALDKVKALRGVEYVWNKGGREGQKDLGFIAQEVEQVIPEIVRENEMPLMDDSGETYKTVDYEKVVAVLVEAMKEQQKQIDELKEKLNA